MQNNGEPVSYIDDGYTQHAYVAPIHNLHPEARFSFRPVPILMQARINKQLVEAGEDAEKREWIAAQWISQQMVQWDIKKPDGDLINHRQIAEVLKVRPILFIRIWRIVSGDDGGDIDPKATSFDMHVKSERDKAVAMCDADEADQGNLSAG